jgi:hypothetical protein
MGFWEFLVSICPSVKWYAVQASNLIDIHASQSKALGREPLSANYNLSVQEVHTQVACLCLPHFANLTALAMVGDSSKNLVPDLPSWVSDLSTLSVPAPFENAEDYFKAGCGVGHHGLEVHGNTLILHGLLFDQIAISSETMQEVEARQGIARLLQIFNSPDPNYTHSNESQNTVIRKLLIAGRLHAASREKLRLSWKITQYPVAKAFRKLFYGILAYGLKRYDRASNFQSFLDDPATALRILAENFDIPLPRDWLLDLLQSGKKEW